MEVVDFVTNYINELRAYNQELKEAIVYLVSGFIVMALAFVAFFTVYRKDKRMSEKRIETMHQEAVQVMKDDVAAKHDLKNVIQNNTRAIENFPEIMKDTIITTIRLASQK